MSKLAFRAQTVDIAYLPLRQDFLAKNVLMTAQRDYGVSNGLLTTDAVITMASSLVRHLAEKIGCEMSF
jgi:hypothetical protein